jgi:hypothetical protein
MKSAVSAMTLYGWRMLIEPSHLGFGYGKTEPPLPYMIDNGAWGSFNRGVPWDGDRFIEMLDMWASGADMIVLPDIVGGGDESLARSVEWLPKVAEYGIPMLLAVQDGMVAIRASPRCRPVHRRLHRVERVYAARVGATCCAGRVLASRCPREQRSTDSVVPARRRAFV